MKSYTPEQVLRILPSVFDRRGFYDRGGRHAPTGPGDDLEFVSSSIDVHASMNGLCDVLDVERALAGLQATESRLLEAVATRPLSEMPTLYGADWAQLVYASCCNVANVA